MKQGAAAYLPRAPSRGWAYPWAGGRIPRRNAGTGAFFCALSQKSPIFLRRLRRRKDIAAKDMPSKHIFDRVVDGITPSRLPAAAVVLAERLR